MNISVRRHLLGIISVLTLIAAAALWFCFEGNDTKMASAICLRVGLGLGAIWLALPQIMAICQKSPPRLMIVTLIGCLVVLVRPWTLRVIAPLIAVMAVLEFVGWMLKPLPRKKKSGSGRKPRK